MTALSKSYRYHPSIILNIFNDIVEMLKGAVLSYNAESLTVETSMYGIKTKYVFRVMRSGDDSVVMVEVQGEREDDKRQVEMIFSIIDNLIASYEEITSNDSRRPQA